MKQPELGKKILALRQQRGLTQEELVEQCNISVRTIQRIEAGEVTPRSYTVKTILQVLDFDMSLLQPQESRVESEFKRLMLLQVDDSLDASFLTKQLNLALIAGIVYFLLAFAEFPADWQRFSDGSLLFPAPIYVIIKVVVVVSFVLFMRGFILCGRIFGNYLLKIAAVIIIFVTIIFYGFDIASIYIESEFFEALLIAEGLTVGVTGILFGIAVIRLKKGVGTLPVVTGIFEIITYAMFTTIVLSLVGFVLLIPMTILEIILLYKVSALLKAKEQELA